MYPLPLQAFACLKVWPLGHDGSVLLSVIAQALLCNFVCRFLLFSLFRLSHWLLSVGSLGFLVLDSILELVIGVELPKEVFTSRVRWMFLIVEWNVSANMFYLLKNLLLLIIVIFKLKCNNLIFNEIMVLNASYVCLHAFSLHRESPDLDPGRQAPHFWGGSVTTKEGFVCLLPRDWSIRYFERLTSLLIPFIQEKIRCTMISRQPIHGREWREMLPSMLPFCNNCQRVKSKHQWTVGMLPPLQVPESKWEEIAVDFIMELPRTLFRYDSLWLIVDRLAKAAHFVPVKITNTGLQLVELYMSRIVCLHGVPKQIMSARGPN
jgi:hypothetical protein